MSYVLFLQYTATVSPRSINRLFFVTEIPIVCGEVGTQVFNPGTYVISWEATVRLASKETPPVPFITVLTKTRHKAVLSNFDSFNF